MRPRPRATPSIVARTCPSGQHARPRAAPSSVARTCPSGQHARPRLRAALAGILSGALALPVHAAPPPTETAPVESPPPETAPAGSPPVVALAADQDEALRRFRGARALYNAGDFRRAALGFEASFAAAPAPESAYNAALAHDRVGDRVATLNWFRRYLTVARRDVDPSYPHAVKRVAELEARLGELSLRIDHPEGLREIRVNGAVVALEDFPLRIEPGRVELRFIGERDGQAVDISSDVPVGGPATIYFPGFITAPGRRTEPPPVQEPPRRQAVDPRDLPGQRALQGLFWSGAGLTGASAIAVGVLGGLTLRAQRDYAAENVPMVPLGGTAANQAEQDRFHDLRLATNVMLGVAGGLAVITLALGIITLQQSRRLRPRVHTGRLRLAASGLQLAF